MANKKIYDYTLKATPVATDEVELQETADGTSLKTTFGAIIAALVAGVYQPIATARSLAVADLSDAATPSVLTVAETTDKIISNYKATGADHVFTMPAAHTLGKVTFIIGDEFQVDIEPNTGDLFYLNGVAMAVDEHIVNISDTLGEEITGYVANINGTLRWMFYSNDAAWVEATP